MKKREKRGNVCASKESSQVYLAEICGQIVLAAFSSEKGQGRRESFVLVLCWLGKGPMFWTWFALYPFLKTLTLKSLVYIYIYIYIYTRGAYDKFLDFFRMNI